MRRSSSNIFHTSLAVHPSSLTARRRMHLGNRVVGSPWYCTTESCYGTRGMEASSWVVVSPALGGSRKEDMHESRTEYPTS
jgi:hypothetical protein